MQDILTHHTASHNNHGRQENSKVKDTMEGIEVSLHDVGFVLLRDEINFLDRVSDTRDDVCFVLANNVRVKLLTKHVLEDCRGDGNADGGSSAAEAILDRGGDGLHLGRHSGNHGDKSAVEQPTKTKTSNHNVKDLSPLGGRQIKGVDEDRAQDEDNGRTHSHPPVATGSAHDSSRKNSTDGGSKKVRNHV